MFYAWSDNFAYRGLCAAPLWSPLGWRFWPQYWKDDDPPDRTCRNFPVQAAGADIMRIAAIRALEAGIRICAIVHDEFVIEARDDDIDQAAETMGEIMMKATEDIVGVSIPVDCYILRHPETRITMKTGKLTSRCLCRCWRRSSRAGRLLRKVTRVRAE